MTHLCVPIFLHSLDQAISDAVQAAELGADLIEFRIETGAMPETITELVRRSPRPCIVTSRSHEEGGKSHLPDHERLDDIERAARSGASFVDFELSTFKRFARLRELYIQNCKATGLTPNLEGPFGPWTFENARVILSSHDFEGRPDRLYNILTELTASQADINKIVWSARTIRDNIEAFEILLARQKPTIALCMGEAGVISRILAKKFGAFLTFASLSKSAETAPGQISIQDMKRLYRWDAITPATKVYGVVGSPIMHSMSPALHNAAFEEVAFDGVYVPLLVNEGYESFKAFMESFLGFAPLNLSGLSITIPHKENALRYLKEKGGEIDQLAQSIGAINTIVIDSQHTLKGFSTDYSAILDSITTKLGITREQLKEYRVAVIGAGGTGRTAVAALAHYGATVVIYNRTHERAEALAAEFNCGAGIPAAKSKGKVVAAKMEKLCDSCCQIFINTTSVGMHPNADTSPIDGQNVQFTPDTLVFDTIYNPIKTKLLQIAEAAGAKTIGGVEMFVRQAAGQFEAWTDKTAPTDLMRQVVEKRLQFNR